MFWLKAAKKVNADRRKTSDDRANLSTWHVFFLAAPLPHTLLAKRPAPSRLPFGR